MPHIENGNYYWDGEGEPDYVMYSLLHGDFETVRRLAKYLAAHKNAVVKVACRSYGWEFMDCHAVRQARWNASCELRQMHAEDAEEPDDVGEIYGHITF